MSKNIMESCLKKGHTLELKKTDSEGYEYYVCSCGKKYKIYPEHNNERKVGFSTFSKSKIR